jgi:O-antigen/teichoic acid export membrane protein
MYTYGVKMMLSGLMITLYSNLSGIVIGNQYDSEDLASYNKGTNYPRTFSLNIVLAATEVLFPTLSKIKNLE